VQRTRKRLVAVVLVAASAAIAARVAAPAPKHVPASVSARLVCGVERWNIKTLKDRPLLLRARSTTVTHLTSLRRPPYLPPRRLHPVLGFACLS
jgi:hypothetical protein